MRFRGLTFKEKLVPSYTEGFILSKEDAVALVGAAAAGYIPLINRRPNGDEIRSVIKSGNIFVIDGSRVQRWTDGMAWSPSRVVGDFLLYREKVSRSRNSTIYSPNCNSVNPMYRALHSDEPLPSLGDMENERQLSSRDYLISSTSLYGSLVKGEKYLPHGLMKKTIAVEWGDHHYRVISYYLPEDVINGLLIRPLSDSVIVEMSGIGATLLDDSNSVASGSNFFLETSMVPNRPRRSSQKSSHSASPIPPRLTYEDAASVPRFDVSASPKVPTTVPYSPSLESMDPTPLMEFSPFLNWSPQMISSDIFTQDANFSHIPVEMDDFDAVDSRMMPQDPAEWEIASWDGSEIGKEAPMNISPPDAMLVPKTFTDAELGAFDSDAKFEDYLRVPMCELSSNESLYAYLNC